MSRAMGGGWGKSGAGGLVDSNGVLIRPDNPNQTKRPIRLGIAAGVTLPIPREEEDDPTVGGPGTHGTVGQPLVNAPPAVPGASQGSVDGQPMFLNAPAGTADKAAFMDLLQPYKARLMMPLQCDDGPHVKGDETLVMKTPQGKIFLSCPNSSGQSIIETDAKEGVHFEFLPAPVAAPPTALRGGWGGWGASSTAAATCVNCGGPRTDGKMVCPRCTAALAGLPKEFADDMKSLIDDPEVEKLVMEAADYMSKKKLVAPLQVVGAAKYYWQYDKQSSKDMSTPVFAITPKKYFDTHKCPDDSFDSEDGLPAGFSNLSESVFEFDGSKAKGEAALRADPLFEEHELVPGQKIQPSVAQVLNAASGQDFTTQKAQLVKELKKLSAPFAKALEDGGITAEDDVTRILLDEDALRAWINPKKDDEDECYDEEEKKELSEIVPPKLDPIRWQVKAAIRKVFPQGDVEVMSGETYILRQV